MASEFGADLGRAYKSLQKKAEPKGFLREAGESVLLGILAGGTAELTKELVSRPIASYRTAQTNDLTRFLAKEELVDSKRKTESAYQQVKQLKAAQLLSETSGISIHDARAEMPSMIAKADLMLNDNKQFQPEAFSPEEKIRIHLAWRKKAALENSDAYDKFLKNATGVIDGNSFKTLAEENYRNQQGVIKGFWNTLRGADPEELALELYKDTPEFKKSLEADAAMEALNTTRNANQTLKALLNLQRGDLDPEFQATFKTVETSTSVEKRGDGYVTVQQRKISNAALGTIDTTSTDVKGSYKQHFTNSDFLVSDIFTTINKAGLVDPARAALLKASLQEVNDTIGLVRNTATGKDEVYDMSKANQYTGDDGLAAQNIYLKNLGIWAAQPKNFVHDAEEKGKMMGVIAKTIQEYQINFGTMKSAYDKYTRVDDADNIIALDAKGNDIADQNSEAAKGKIRQRLAAQDEILAIQNLFTQNYKITLGVSNDLIDIKSDLVVIDIGGNTKTLPKLTPLPKLAIGIGKRKVTASGKEIPLNSKVEGKIEDQFLFPENVPEEVQKRNTDIYYDWQAGVVPSYGPEYTSPRTTKRLELGTERQIQKPEDATEEVITKAPTSIKEDYVGLYIEERGLNITDGNIIESPVEPPKFTGKVSKGMSKDDLNEFREAEALSRKAHRVHQQNKKEFEKILARVNPRPEGMGKTGRSITKGPSPKIELWKKRNKELIGTGIPVQLFADLFQDYSINPDSILASQ